MIYLEEKSLRDVNLPSIQIKRSKIYENKNNNVFGLYVIFFNPKFCPKYLVRRSTRTIESIAESGPEHIRQTCKSVKIASNF